jgi:hypothetical protein
VNTYNTNVDGRRRTKRETLQINLYKTPTPQDRLMAINTRVQARNATTQQNRFSIADQPVDRFLRLLDIISLIIRTSQQPDRLFKPPTRPALVYLLSIQYQATQQIHSDESPSWLNLFDTYKPGLNQILEWSRQLGRLRRCR